MNAFEFMAKTTSPITEETDCLMMFITDKEAPLKNLALVDEALSGKIGQLLKADGLEKRFGEYAVLETRDDIEAKRLMLIYSGQALHSDRDFIDLAEQVASCCLNTRVKTMSVCLDNVSVENRDDQWVSRQLTEAVINLSYRYDVHKSIKPPQSLLSNIHYLAVDEVTADHYQKGIKTGIAIGNGITLTRNLGNMPANICTPSYLAAQARLVSDKHPEVEVDVLDETQMQALGMHSLLSVGQSSAEPSQFIVMHYHGGKDTEAPYALVGKGITFDSGGLIVKPLAGSKGAMVSMKYDMCGAAAVFGVLDAIIELDLAINVVCIIAAAENMINGHASRPGDIVTSMSGKTIEIINTDAEGRLVLCDALTYVERYKPKTVIDIATLTGGVVIALGDHAAGLYSNDDDFAETLLTAGQQSGDRAWHMPLWNDYSKQLISPMADLLNSTGPKASSVMGACFLAEFAKAYTWAHLDIVGVAYDIGECKGATGKPVALLTEYLIGCAEPS